MRTGRTGGQAVGQTDRRHKLRQYPTAWMDQGSTLGYIFSSYFNNLCGHHFWVIFRILTLSLWSWKIQHISIPYINLVALRKSVLSCCWKDEHRILIIIAQQGTSPCVGMSVSFCSFPCVSDIYCTATRSQEPRSADTRHRISNCRYLCNKSYKLLCKQ